MSKLAISLRLYNIFLKIIFTIQIVLVVIMDLHGFVLDQFTSVKRELDKLDDFYLT